MKTIQKHPEVEARKLLEDFNEQHLPIAVGHIAQGLGIQLSYRPFDGDISGMLYRDGTRTIIGVNASHPETRQRFTVAHELGHFSLHEGRPMIVDKLARINLRNTVSSLATDKEEIEANQFAAELLMPRDMVTEFSSEIFAGSSEFIDSKTLVERIAARFHVSISAMEYRLINLGIVIPQ